VIRDLLKLVERPGVRSLAGGLPAPESFPVGRMREAVDRVLGRSEGIASPLQYGPTEGVGVLREWVAAVAEPVATIDQVVITTGSQQGLDLLAHALCDPGDVILVEEPAYLGALQAFRSAGADLVPVPLVAGGLDVDVLAEQVAALRAAGRTPKACYVAPNFQNPTGATMSTERRRQLGELADRLGIVVIEDDPYRDLRFAGEPLPSIRQFGELVVSLGSGSKVLAPGLRVGWMVAPAWLVPAVVRLKQARDLHTSSLSQWVAHDVLADDGFMAAHRRGLADLYGTRCAVMVDALRRHFGTAVEFVPPDGGMFVWVRLAGLDTTALLATAVDHGVAFVPGGAFYVADGAFDGFDRARLSFATLLPDELDDAVSRLASAVADASR
jgi:2-aminoadipate transaminase